MVQWPNGTPDDVQSLADQLADVLRDKNGQVAGPAALLMFSYVVAELGGVGDDGKTVSAIIRDAAQLARRYGALHLPTLN